ncbi:MAG: hypothetical protein WCI93_00165 [bacterium]
MKNVEKFFGPSVVELEIQIPAEGKNNFIYCSLRNNKRKKAPDYEIDDDNFNIKNFGEATNKLVPGEKYLVSFFPKIDKTVSPKNCLIFLSIKNSLLPGAEGLLRVLQLGKEKMPKGMYLNFLVKKENMWKDSQSLRRFPRLYIHLDGEAKISLGYYDCELTQLNLLVSIVKI